MYLSGSLGFDLVLWSSDWWLPNARVLLREVISHSNICPMEFTTWQVACLVAVQIVNIMCCEDAAHTSGEPTHPPHAACRRRPQWRFLNDVQSFTKVMHGMGNPFLATGRELITLDKRAVMDDAVAVSLSKIHEVGQVLHKEYVNTRLAKDTR